MPAPGRLSAAQRAPLSVLPRMPTRRRKRNRPSNSSIRAQPRDGREPIPIGVRLARACRDAAIPSPETHLAAAVMTHALKIALWSVSLFLWGIQASTLAVAADERDRGRAEPRQEARTPGVRPGPRLEGRPAFDGRGQVLDRRYNHGRYYPPRGAVLRSLPDGYRPYYRGGSRYYFSGGIWYAPRGPEFVVEIGRAHA